MSVATATIFSDKKIMGPTFELLSVDTSKEVNRIPYAQLILADGNAAKQFFQISDGDFFLPGKEVEIKLRYEDAPEDEATVFKGLVIKQSVEADSQGSTLTVDLKDAAIKLHAARKSALYTEKSLEEIIEALAKNGLKKGEIKAPQAKRKEKELVQYYCSDWDFILARAESCGLLLVADDGEISLPKMAIQGEPKGTLEFGNSLIHELEIEADASHQYAQIESLAWDVKTQKLTKATKAEAVEESELKPGNLEGSQLAKKLGRDTQTLTNAVILDPEELQAWSNGALAKARMSMIRGRISLTGRADIKLMDVIEIKGVGKRFNGKTLVTGIRHRVNLRGWQTDLQFGLPPKRFVEKRDLSDVPAAGLLPAVNGLQIGVVDKFEEDPEKEFRLKVILPGIDPEKGTIWARLATPDAGMERGYFFRPEVGDEVVVGFFNDDPRQPVVLGAMFSSANTPPATVATLDEKNINKGIVTKTGTTIGFIDDEKASVFIETPQQNTLVLDDDEESVLLSDQHGNSITLSKDGIEIKSAKDLKIDAGGNVEIKGAKVDIK